MLLAAFPRARGAGSQQGVWLPLSDRISQGKQGDYFVNAVRKPLKLIPQKLPGIALQC